MASIPVEGHTFFIIGLALSLVSSLFAIMIAGYTLRGYLLTRNKTSLFFSLSFILLGLGIFARVAFDYINRSEIFPTLKYFALENLTSPQSILVMLSIFFVASGYAILIALFFRIPSKRVMALLIVLLGLLTVNTHNAYITAHVLPVILLFFVLLHTTDNFLKRRTANTFLVFSSFTLLFVSELFFLLIAESLLFYFVGSALRLLAYIYLLANMWLVLKHDLKKGKA